MQSAPTIDAAVAGGPLAGRTVVVMHAAWHSCGSYRINVTQAAAYRALGAHTISYALRELPGGAPPGAKAWRDYIAMTPDMPAHERFYSNPSAGAIAQPSFWRDVFWPLAHGNHARSMPALMARAPVPPGLAGRKIDFIHCNHYFCIPAALKLFGEHACPIAVETQDIQADQYELRNKGLPLLPPRASYDEMLAEELAWLRRADALIHLNGSEFLRFGQLLPEMRNLLVFPAVPPAPTGPGADDIVIVASANYPNYLSVKWFVEDILPRAGDVPVKIVGNVDGEFRLRAPRLLEKHRANFLGRVDDIDSVYANAGLVLLPTSEGHGLSIKAVEALSSGAPLIATSAAFRGMRVDPETLANVTLVEDAEGFARALRKKWEQGVATDPAASGVARGTSDTRKFYDRTFSLSAYTREIGGIVTKMIEARSAA